MDAFDADVLIYAAAAGHSLGRRVRHLLPVEATSRTGAVAGIGQDITEVDVVYPNELPEG